MFFSKTRGQGIELIVWTALALIIAVIVIGIMIYNKGGMIGAIEKIKNIFRFGR